MNPTDMARAQWRKSSRSSANGACVELAATSPGIALRDSKNPHGPILTLRADDWRRFVRSVKRGDQDA